MDAELSSLKDLLCRNSVRFGSFKLVSGQVSDVYVDAKLTTCTAKAMPLVGRAFLRKVRALGWKPKAVGGLTLGADPIALAIAHESSGEIDAFIVRKEAKKHGTGRSIEGLDNTSGLPVVIIDDVCSTGGSTATAIEQARAAGMDILGAICLVDREMGAPEKLARDYGCALESIFKLSDLRSGP